MIFDNLKNKERYKDIPWLYKALSSVEKYADLEAGKYPIDENDRVIVNLYNTEKHDPAKYENHRFYIDIQLMIKGSESILTAPRDACTELVAYNQEKDVEFVTAAKEKAVQTHLSDGDFVVVYPGEAHVPGTTYDNPCDVRKIIFKIKA